MHGDDAPEWLPPPPPPPPALVDGQEVADGFRGFSSAGVLVLVPFLLFYRLVERLTEAAFRAVDWWRARQGGDRRSG
ncbi:MAG: hypothetical protein JNK12_05700 [Acidimicrobiales bacterium]|nr:hypothetical protein [Acidimicrobiales bacterium]